MLLNHKVVFIPVFFSGCLPLVENMWWTNFRALDYDLDDYTPWHLKWTRRRLCFSLAISFSESKSFLAGDYLAAINYCNTSTCAFCNFGELKLSDVTAALSFDDEKIDLDLQWFLIDSWYLKVHMLIPLTLKFVKSAPHSWFQPRWDLQPSDPWSLGGDSLNQVHIGSVLFMSYEDCVFSGFQVFWCALTEMNFKLICQHINSLSRGFALSFSWIRAMDSMQFTR